MCMEDIRLGRKTQSQCRVFSVIAGTPQVIAPGNPNRIALTIGTVSATLTGVYPRTIDDTALNGFDVSSSSGPLELSLSNVGSLVWEEWKANPSAGTVRITVIETILYDK